MIVPKLHDYPIRQYKKDNYLFYHVKKIIFYMVKNYHVHITVHFTGIRLLLCTGVLLLIPNQHTEFKTKST